jgi:hypothetical protein
MALFGTKAAPDPRPGPVPTVEPADLEPEPGRRFSHRRYGAGHCHPVALRRPHLVDHRFAVGSRVPGRRTHRHAADPDATQPDRKPDRHLFGAHNVRAAARQRIRPHGRFRPFWASAPARRSRPGRRPGRSQPRHRAITYKVGQEAYTRFEMMHMRGLCGPAMSSARGTRRPPARPRPRHRRTRMDRTHLLGGVDPVGCHHDRR